MEEETDEYNAEKSASFKQRNSMPISSSFMSSPKQGTTDVVHQNNTEENLTLQPIEEQPNEQVKLQATDQNTQQNIYKDIIMEEVDSRETQS